MTNLQTRLALFESPPPEGTWSKIVEGLEASPRVAQRLYDYAPAPPAGAWAAVEKNLSPNSVKIIPFFARLRKPVRYAAAASVIGITLITSTLLVRRTEAGSLPAESGGTTVVQQGMFTNPFKRLQGSKSFLPLTANEVKALLQRRRRTSFVNPQSFVASPVLQGLGVPYVCNHGPLNGYVTATDGNGTPLSLAAGLFPMFGCSVHGPVCTGRIKALRDSLSAFGMTPLFPAVMETLHNAGQKP